MPRWRTLLGHYPATQALREGRVSSPQFSLDFADVPVPHTPFKRVVRDLEFAVAELALMIFLMARSRGVPLGLLPVALFAGNPLNLLVYRTNLGRVAPRDLEGRRVGVRAYTTITAVWARALLAGYFGVDLDRLQWFSYEEGHVAGVTEPSNVHRNAGHADLGALLLSGEIEAAIVDPVPTDPGVARLVAAADDVWCGWQRAIGARTVNHVVVVRESLAEDTHRMSELLHLFRQSHDLMEPSAAGTFSVGFEAIAPSLQAAIGVAHRQHLLAGPLAVEDLVIHAS